MRKSAQFATSLGSNGYSGETNTLHDESASMGSQATEQQKNVHRDHYSGIQRNGHSSNARKHEILMKIHRQINEAWKNRELMIPN